MRAVAITLLAALGVAGCGAAVDRVGEDGTAASLDAANPAGTATATEGTVEPADSVDDSEPVTSTASTPPTSLLPAGTESATDTVASVPSPLGSAPQTFDLPDCPDSSRGAVADKARQRFWLCQDGVAITNERPMTTASQGYGLPPVGTYEVFARDETAFGINGAPLERFVAFFTTSRGNRIAFHEVVDQDPSTVGDLDQRGASAGCFRILEDDSYQVWDHLQIGDPVVIISN